MKSISRIKGNAYDKIDQSSFMRYPRYEDVERTSFLDVRKLVLCRPEDPTVTATADEDVSQILEDIMNEDFGKRENHQKVMCKKMN